MCPTECATLTAFRSPVSVNSVLAVSWGCLRDGCLVRDHKLLRVSTGIYSETNTPSAGQAILDSMNAKKWISLQSSFTQRLNGFMSN